MSSELLTSDELNALMHEGKRPSVEAESVDLTVGERGLRRVSPHLERLLSQFAVPAASVFATALRTLCSGTPRPLEIVGPSAVEKIGTEIQFTVEVRLSKITAYIGLSRPLAYVLVERAFGGSLAKLTQDLSTRPASRIERDIFFPILDEIGHHIATVLGVSGTIDVTPAEESLHIQARESAALWQLDLGLPTEGCFLAVLLPSNIAEIFSKSTPQKSLMNPIVASNLLQAPVGLTVILGKAELTLASLLSLRTGDIVRLERNQQDPLPVLVEGEIKFLARPVHKNGGVAVAIDKETP